MPAANVDSAGPGANLLKAMPELPDVENYRRYLGANALHKSIAGVHVGSARILRGIGGKRLSDTLAGRSMQTTRRHGKHLMVQLDDGGWLTFHFGMTGRFRYFKRLQDDPKHDRLRIDFDNGYHLAFENQRLLGEVGVAKDADAFVGEHDMGPDALEIDEATFREKLGKRRGGIKTALMNQSLAAGIGNVYSDEILFQAGVHPATSVKRLDRSDISSLYRTMRSVLETAIECGAGSEDLAERLPEGWLLPHRQEGTRCPRCGGKVEAFRTGGRRGFLCPSCQPKKN